MSMAPLERLRHDPKDITKIQPLALRGEITTWQYDAKNCILLYYRMIDGNIWSHNLFNALVRWAHVLLVYASALGFEEKYPADMCIGRPNILQGYWYLTAALRNIRMQKWSDYKISEFRIERKVDNAVLRTSIKGQSRCALCYNPLSKHDAAVRYRCRVGRTTQLSSFVGETSLRKLVSKINRATKKHSDSKYRNSLIEKMRSKKYGSSKLRAGYRKA